MILLNSNIMKIYSFSHVKKIFLIAKSVISTLCIQSLNGLYNGSDNELEKERIFFYETEVLTLT